jgi:hypothetical protein
MKMFENFFVHSANFKEDMCDDSPFTQKEIFVMTDLDREVVMHACKKFLSWIGAVMEATGVFIK